MTQGLQNRLTCTSLTCTINGEPIRLQDVSPTLTLLQYLQQSHRTGTKEGCGDGDCGACTVALLSQNAEGQPHYEAVNSCLMPLAALAGREIVTVEGLADARSPHASLHPVQAAMIETGGSQCGYCTPGFIMSLFAAYYDRNLHDGRVDDRAIEGNLCRCTGYLSIRRAAQRLTKHQPDRFTEKLPVRASPHSADLQWQQSAVLSPRPPSRSLGSASAAPQCHPDGGRDRFGLRDEPRSPVVSGLNFAGSRGGTEAN